MSKVDQQRPVERLKPRVIPRDEHCISRANVGVNALKVLYRLKDAGFEGYLVGGGVRDLLLGREPKDFDVVTDALPEQVRQLFRNSRLIGRRFRLVHVHFGREVVEVATFRGHHFEEATSTGEGVVRDGRIIRDNVYGSIEEDALRRDFTVNSLYYNIRDFSVVDYIRGMEDLRTGTLRVIGDPETRYREDPVRMLRAARFAANLGFRLHEETEAAVFRLGHLLSEVSAARLFDEVLKLFHGGCALETFENLRRLGLFGYLFPLTEEALAHEEDGFPLTFVAHAMRNTDTRIGENKPVTAAFLYAVLLWEPVRKRVQDTRDQGMTEVEAIQIASNGVFDAQLRHTAIPRRFTSAIREIWMMQPRFQHRRGKRALRLLQHPRFRAAYDFFCLRARCGEAAAEACEWWTRLQELDEPQQRRMVQLHGRRPGRRSARARRPTGA